jgi:hypothetical protein
MGREAGCPDPWGLSPGSLSRKRLVPPSGFPRCPNFSSPFQEDPVHAPAPEAEVPLGSPQGPVPLGLVSFLSCSAIILGSLQLSPAQGLLTTAGKRMFGHPESPLEIPGSELHTEPCTPGVQVHWRLAEVSFLFTRGQQGGAWSLSIPTS